MTTERKAPATRATGIASTLQPLAAPSAIHPVVKSERPEGGVHRVVRAPAITLGRGADNDVVVDDLLVSRRHAVLELQPDGSYAIVDLDSRNGTFVNGRQVQRARLQELDVVGVGHHQFRLVEAGLEEYVDDGLVSFEASGLTVRLSPDRVLLDDVGFALDERSFVAVLGPSGSGKSTLLNALTGYRPAREGSVLYGGRDLYEEYQELRGRIGFVPQDDIVHAPLTVCQALTYAGRLRLAADVAADEVAGRVGSVLEELDLTSRADTPINRLSGGQRRRVSVGLELVAEPSLLFLDEPTSGLDPGYERSLMALLRRLADDGRTVVVVTHSVQSLRLCDRIVFLAPGGRLAYFGPPQLAAAYFGCEDLQEAFQLLSEGDGESWAQRFREHPYHRQYAAPRSDEQPSRTVAPAPATRPKRPRPREWMAQFAMLTGRYTRVMASDRRNLALTLAQPPLLGLLMLAALPAGELSTPTAGEVRVVSRAGLVLLVVVLGMTWLGASNAIREVAKELPIYRRERAAGLSVGAYVASKITVLAALTILQAAILVPIALARQGGPDDGSVLPLPMLELILAGALAGLASMGVALLISSIAGTVDRAMTVLPLVLVMQMLLTMGGLFPDLIDKPVLREASYLSSAQWGFSAMASTVDIERLDATGRLARQVPNVRLQDPTPVLTALAGPPESDYRWRHGEASWLLDIGFLLAIAGVATAGASVALARKRPEA